MLSGAKILVTGASGQIGFAVAARLADANDVWGLGRLGASGARERLEATGVVPHACDLAEGDFTGLPDDFDYVLHLATFRHGGLDYDQAMRVNAEGTHLLYRHCRKAKAVLVMSTAEVYKPREDPLHVYLESDPLGDSNSVFDPTYSVSKIAEEAVARACARAYEVPTTIGRMNAAYGSIAQGLLGFHLEWLLAGEPVVVKWNPAMYSPIHHDDIAGQAGALLEAAKVPATIVNWGGDEPVAAQEWCAYMGELTGKHAEVAVREVPGGIRGVVVDVSRRQEITGPCTVDWRDGVRRLVEERLAASGADGADAARFRSALA